MLGERIQELRKQVNLSQEALGEKLNVSRQAVSKWETGLSNPDTENLIRLAEIFKISVDELAGSKSSETAAAVNHLPKKRATRLFRILAAAVILMIIVAAAIWYGTYLGSRADTDTAVNKPSSSDAAAEALNEYILNWAEDGSKTRQVLAIGEQNGVFPWNTPLSGNNTFHLSGDMPGVEWHTAVCKDIEINYSRNIETGKEFIGSMRTTSPQYKTPRGIKVSDTEAELIAEYGDALLVRPETYSETDDFCIYNSLYAFTIENDVCNFVVFYVLDGRISGIEVIAAVDGGPAYYADNVNTFHLLNGKPDYSKRQEPELETLSKERKVYVALQTLLNHSMTEEDASAYRKTIFNGLRFIDWTKYGKLGEAGNEFETIQELLSWIDAQETFTDAEMIGLQLVLETNIDGIYCDMYSGVLCNAFFKNPAAFIECLSNSPGNAKNSKNVVIITVYGAAVTSEKLESFEAELHELINCGALSDGAVPWAEQLLERCSHPYGDAN